jgi:hypothetical protein
MPHMSVAEFFQALEKSALLSDEQYELARQQLAAESDPKMVARRLLADGRITTWQARQLLHGRHALTIGPYKLLDKAAGDDTDRAFLARHSQSGQTVELRALSRSQAAKRPDAVQEFVEAAEKLSVAESRKLVEVHRPEGQDDTCYVALEPPAGGVSAALASADSGVEVERAAAEQTQAADPPSPDERDAAEPAAQEQAAATPTAAEIRPPKLKPKAKPATAPAAPASGGTPSPQDKAASAAPSIPAIEIKLPGQDAPQEIAAAPQAFKIATGKRRKKPSAAPAEKSAPRSAKSAGDATAGDANAAGEEKSAPAGKPGRALSPALLIGGAVGGGGLLVTIVVVAWVLLSGGDGEQVADAGAGESPAASAKEAPGAGEEGSDQPPPAAAQPTAESEPDDPVVDPVVIVEAAPAASPEAKSEANPDTPPVVQSDAKGPEMAKSPEPSPAAEAKPADVPAEPAKETQPAPAAAGAPVESANPGEAKIAPAAETPKVKPAPSEEAAKSEAKKPAAPPPDKKPFADLKDSAALPDPTAADGDQPKPLGPVYIPPGELCFIKLRGGEKAFKGAQQFAMKNAQGGLAEREWEISIREGASGNETVIASLAIDDKSQLVFQWKPEAKTQTMSPYLSNCAFSLACAGEAKAVILRQPVSAEALAVDFDKPSSKNDWEIDNCPDPAAVRFEITGVSGAKFTVDPTGPQEAEKATVWIRVEDGGGMLSLKLDASLKRDFQLTATPHIKAPEAAKPDKFVRRMFNDSLKKAEFQSNDFSARIKMMQEYAKSKAPDAKQIEQRLPVFELDAKNAATLVQNMKKIDELLKKLEGGMQIQFRVFYDADTTEVNLLKVGS